MSTLNRFLLSKNSLILNSIDVCDKDNINDFICVLNEIGYNVSEALYERLKTTSVDELKNTLDMIKEASGINYNWKTLVDGFPFSKNTRPSHYEMVIMSYINYLTDGMVTFALPPDSKHDKKEWKAQQAIDAFETNKTLDLITIDNVESIFTNVLESKDSLPSIAVLLVKEVCQDNSHFLKKVVETSNIEFRETLALVNAYRYLNGDTPKVKTLTDILRMLNVITKLEQIDLTIPTIELANIADLESFRMPKTSRKQRRLLVSLIENITNPEDIKRYSSYWNSVFHGIHIGEYADIAPTAYALACLIRNNLTITTFDSKVANLKAKGLYLEAAKLLATRPSILLRGIDELVRKSSIDDVYKIIDLFASVMKEKGNPKLLIQLYNHLFNRNEASESRVIKHPKKPKLVTKHLPTLDENIIDSLQHAISESLMTSFAKKPVFDSDDVVYVDPMAYNVYMPSNLSNSSSLDTFVGQGTRVALNSDFNKNILRLFIHWKASVDIDLHGTILDKDFKTIDTCSFYNTDGKWFQHSGDVRSAPNGDAEFIDFKLYQKPVDAKYILLTANVFSSGVFKDIPECFAGFMMLDKKMMHSTFEPKLVKERFTLSMDAKQCLLLAFDLETKEFIWLDYASDGRVNVFSKEILENALSTNRMSIGQLMEYHIKAAQATLTNVPEGSTVKVMRDGDVDPFDFSLINSRFIG